MYFIKTPLFVQRMLSNMVWKTLDADVIYLTFDDGPIPESTPIILDILDQYNAKATFFCVGENVERYPELYQAILDRGHGVGNHTFNHLNGWYTDSEEYVANVDRSSDLIDSNLFRPPYGKLRPAQIDALKERYHIIMWDVLSGDFDPKVTSEDLYMNVTKHSKEGSIIVLHDNLKSIDKVKEVLPKLITFYQGKGMELKPLSQFRSEMGQDN